MEEISIVGVDLAKNIFHVHGATTDGRPVCATNLFGLRYTKNMHRNSMKASETRRDTRCKRVPHPSAWGGCRGGLR